MRPTYVSRARRWLEQHVSRRSRPEPEREPEGHDRLAEMRQQLLFLSLATPNLNSQVVAWSHYDGTGRTNATSGDAAQPPYESVVAAMRDGWRVIQVPTLAAAVPGQEHSQSFVRFEYVLEKLQEVGRS